MRIMGLDLGEKTIGIAISDPLGLTAQGLTTIKRGDLDEDLKKLKELIEAYEVQNLVLGLPKNMDGSLGPQSEKISEFKGILEEQLNIKVFLQDERLSTKEAEKFLISANVRRSKRKTVIDKIAAVVILQTYLDRRIGDDKKRV